MSLLLCAALLLPGCHRKPSQDSSDIYKKLGSVLPEGYKDSVLMGTYEVFADREAGEGRKIPLFVAVSPALDRNNIKEPIFIIQGGPGLAASDALWFYHNTDSLYRKNRDMVFIDIRGTGRSEALHCPELQNRKGLHAILSDEYPPQEVEACAAIYRDSINFNHYRTDYIIEDLEEIRNWLGYDKINIWGASYGGKAALVYMNRFPESIHKVVLHSPGLPWREIALNRSHYTQQAMDRLFEKCEADPECSDAFPDLKSEFRELAQRLRDTTLKVQPYPNDTTTLEITWDHLTAKIGGMLRWDHQYIRLPYIIHQAREKNYAPLLKEFKTDKDGIDQSFALGLWFSINCAENAPLTAQHAARARQSDFGDYTYRQRQLLCSLWDVEDRSSDFLQVKEMRSDIPTLVISGGMDPTTPASASAALENNLSNMRHVIIPDMGHMFSGLSNIESCYDTGIVEFFDTDGLPRDLGCFQEMLRQPFYTPEETN